MASPLYGRALTWTLTLTWTRTCTRTRTLLNQDFLKPAAQLGASATRCLPEDVQGSGDSDDGEEQERKQKQKEEQKQKQKQKQEQEQQEQEQDVERYRLGSNRGVSIYLPIFRTQKI